MTGLFARHTGRHCRRWFHPAADVSQPASSADDFSRIPTPVLAPLVAFPMASDDLPATTSYRYPYPSKGDAA